MVNAIEPAARTRMTEDLLGDLADSLDPALVAPLALWLSSAECETTGEVYNVGGGRVARVLVAETPGLFCRDLTPEEIRARWEDINDADAVEVMTNFQQEMALLGSMLSERIERATH